MESLRFEMTNGETVTFEREEYDEYEYCFGMLVVKRGNAWIAAFNMREVRYFIVDGIMVDTNE